LVGTRFIGAAAAAAFPATADESALAHCIYIPIPYHIVIGTNGFGRAGIAQRIGTAPQIFHLDFCKFLHLLFFVAQQQPYAFYILVPGNC
jgi:hypothetical protein